MPAGMTFMEAILARAVVPRANILERTVTRSVLELAETNTPESISHAEDAEAAVEAVGHVVVEGEESREEHRLLISHRQDTTNI
jgi:hypothetical protein